MHPWSFVSTIFMIVRYLPFFDLSMTLARESYRSTMLQCYRSSSPLATFTHHPSPNFCILFYKLEGCKGRHSIAEDFGAYQVNQTLSYSGLSSQIVRRDAIQMIVTDAQAAILTVRTIAIWGGHKKIAVLCIGLLVAVLPPFLYFVNNFLISIRGNMHPNCLD
jgi:hypothetical protein